MERKWYTYNKIVQLNGGKECIVDGSNRIYIIEKYIKQDFIEKFSD